jgi:sodium/proline symporter
MTQSAVISLSLFALVAAILVIAVSAGRRTHHAADYLGASRRLGAMLSSAGYLGGASSAWMVVILAAAAFSLGAAAIWWWISFVLAAVLGLFYIGPRLRTLAAAHNAHTLTQVIFSDAGDRLNPVLMRSAALIALLLLGLQASVLVRAAAELLAIEAQHDIARVITISLAMIVVCLFAGGIRAASACDALQAALLAGVALLLPIPAYFALGDWQTISHTVSLLPVPLTDWFGDKRGVVALAFACGPIAIGLAMAGQPQAMAKLIAVKDESALRRARWLGLAWTVVVLAAVLVCGWLARALYDGLQRPELALHALASRLLPPWLAGMFIAALFSALVLGVASPMLALATQLSIDLRRSTSPLSISLARAMVVIVAIFVLFVASATPASLLDHGLFAFTTLGACFGPILLVRLSGKRLRPGSLLGAMWAAFVLAVIFHLLPDSPGDFLERVLPFVAALGIALTGGERRRNPDRADRAQETVHDRIPI